MKKLLYIFMVLMLVQQVNASTNYLPLNWYFYSDYKQGSIYGLGTEGYILEDTCYGVVDLTFINIGGPCASGGPGTQYAYSGTFTSSCLGGQNILNHLFDRSPTGIYATPFVSGECTARPCPEDTGLVNETWILRQDGFNAWGTSQTLVCDPETGNKTCVITFSSNLGDADVDNYVCYNDDIEWDSTIHQLQFWVDTWDPYNAFDTYSNHDAHNLFTHIDNYSEGMVRWQADGGGSLGYFGWMQNGTIWDLNFTESYQEQLNAIDKTFIINITQEPEGLGLDAGTTGLWDCDTPGKAQYYIPDGAKPTLNQWNNIKANCCNLFGQGNPNGECYNNWVSGNNGVDVNGDKSIHMDFACGTEEFRPQFIYKFDSIAYPEHYLPTVRIDMKADSDDPSIYTVFWDEQIGSPYSACFKFYDKVNSSRIAIENSYWAFSEVEGEFQNAFEALSVDSNFFALSLRTPKYYKVHFETTGYNTSLPIEDQFKENPECKDVYMKRAVTVEETDGYNRSIHVMYRRGPNDYVELSGVSLIIKCQANNEFYDIDSSPGKTGTNGYSIYNQFLPMSDCWTTVNKKNCEGDRRDFYIVPGEFVKDVNVTIRCNADVDDGDETPPDDEDYEEPTTLDIGFFVHELNSDVGKIAIEIFIKGGTIDTSVITNEFGVQYKYDLPVGTTYSISVNNEKYLPFKEDYNGQEPFDITLISLQQQSHIGIYAYLNGTEIGEAWITIKNENGETLKTLRTNNGTNLGFIEYTCNLGEKVSFFGTFGDYTGKIESVVCEAEGKNLDMDLTIGNDGITAEKAIELRDFIYDNIFELFQYILYILALVVFFKALDSVGKRN